MPDLWALAREASERKDHRTAADYYRRILEQEPENYYALLNLGNCVGALNDNDEAMRLYRKAIPLKPASETSSWALWNLAELLRQRGETLVEKNPAEARKLLEEAYQLRSDNIWICNSLGWLHAQLGNTEAEAGHFHATEALETASGHYSISERYYRESMRCSTNPDEVKVPQNNGVVLYTRAAELFSQHKRHDWAVQACDRAATFKAHEWTLLVRGRALKQLGRVDEAIRAFEESGRVHPQYYWCWLELGLCHLDQRRLDDAERAFRAAIPCYPAKEGMEPWGAWNLAVVLRLRAEAMGERNEWSAALPLLTEAESLRPRDCWVLVARARTLLHLEQTPQALEACRQALDVAATDTDRADAACAVGNALLDRQEYAAALPLFERGLQAAPNNPYNLNGRGRALWGLKRLGEAAAAFRRAMPVWPAGGTNYPRSNLTGVLWEWLHAVEKEPGSAAQQQVALLAAELAQLTPDDPWPHYHLGSAAHKLQKLDEAEEHLQRAVTLDPHKFSIQWLYFQVLAARKDCDGLLRAIESLKVCQAKPGSSELEQWNHIKEIGWLLTGAVHDTLRDARRTLESREPIARLMTHFPPSFVLRNAYANALYLCNGLNQPFDRDAYLKEIRTITDEMVAAYGSQLDSRLPAIGLPLEGLCTVGQGWHGEFSHADPMGCHAVDYMGTDDEKRWYVGDRTRRENYAGWGRPLLAVYDGVVVAARDSSPDGDVDHDAPFASNLIEVQHTCPDGSLERSMYVHVQHGSVVVKVGDRVRRGQVLGRLGCSGRNANLPHLHFALLSDRPDRTNGLSLRFRHDGVECREPSGAWAPLGSEPGAANGGALLRRVS